VQDPYAFLASATAQATVAVPAPGSGPGFWAGASSAAFGPKGLIAIAYRLRTPDRRGSSIVVAISEDGRHLETVDVIEKESFSAESLERPALVRLDRGWRLYMSCATPGSKHWRVDAIDAARPEEFHNSTPRGAFAGSDLVGVKDPVVRRQGDRWQAWLCCHPLDQPGEEDRMSTSYAISDDGLEWRWLGDVLSGRPGYWDARGARVTSVLPDGRASYDGRANREENFSERTGLALPQSAGASLQATGDGPVANVRYLDMVPVPTGGHLAYFERPRADGSHDLCVVECPG
jgi:hypothetical protein